MAGVFGVAIINIRNYKGPAHSAVPIIRTILRRNTGFYALQVV
jgi:hypothetical protein